MQLHAALLLSAAVTAPALALPQRGNTTPPPGMVLIEGGRTAIGTPEKEVLAIGEADELDFGKVIPETPQHTVDVDDFFLMRTEVTNEQYLAYVRAAGAAPPESWAETSINVGQRAYLDEMEGKIKAAKDAGEIPPDRVPFDRSRWWRSNWKEHDVEGEDWEMPEQIASMPVVYVDYQDAQSYARWAGLRLMTEYEFQRAGRGKDKISYTWGDEFDPAKCVTGALRIDRPRPVGSSPGGASSEGVVDLCGNVWEWTSSPFVPYPKWKMLELKIGRGKSGRKIDGLVAWDENKRVAVSGSFQNGALAARVTTRRDSDRYQSTDSLGFRCAASLSPGFDLAANLMSVDVPAEARPEGVEYSSDLVVAMDRWSSSEGTAGVEGYAVIESYDYALYIPVEKLDITSANQLREDSNETGPMAMGILSLTMSTIEPALPAGTYFVSFLGKSKNVEPPVPSSGIAAPQDDGQGEEVVIDFSADLPEGIDRSRDNLIFHSTNDEPVAALPLAAIDFVRPKAPSVIPGEGTRMVPQPNKKGEMVPTPVPCDQLIMNVNTTVRVSNKGFNYNIVLKLDEGALGDGWRR